MQKAEKILTEKRKIFQVIENENITGLKDQLDLLKTEYIKLLNDKDVLINWGKPQLEALYNTRIGVHKIQILQLTLQVKS